MTSLFKVSPALSVGSPRLGGDEDSEEEEDEKNEKKSKTVEKLSDGKQQQKAGRQDKFKEIATCRK